jgi:CelD/BcsL family acetyltransferase involved in cellulose biosynthesis
MELVIDVSEDCRALEPAWRQLESTGCCYIFQRYDWVCALLDTVGASHGVRPRIVIVRDRSSRPQMIVPLMIVRSLGVRTVCFVDFELADYNAPLIDRDFAESITAERWQRLWQEIRDRLAFDIVRFEKMPDLIEGAKNPFRLLPCNSNAMAFEFDVSGDTPSLLEASKGYRTSQRKRRRLGEKGALAFAVASSPEEIEALTRRMIELKSRRYVSTGTVDLFEDASYRQFYLLLARSGFRDGSIHVSATTVDGEAIAVHFGAVWHTRYYWLMPAFDDAWGKYSPGRLLLEDVVSWAGTRGLEILDLTIGGEEYKFDWPCRSQQLYIHKAARNPAGWAHLAGSSALAAGITQLRRLQSSQRLWRVARAVVPAPLRARLSALSRKA